jgi:hypothetical protein
MEFDIFTTVMIHVVVFWIITPGRRIPTFQTNTYLLPPVFNLVAYRHSELQHQVRTNASEVHRRTVSISYPENMKRWYSPTRLHGVMIQNNIFGLKETANTYRLVFLGNIGTHPQENMPPFSNLKIKVLRSCKILVSTC